MNARQLLTLLGIAAVLTVIIVFKQLHAPKPLTQEQPQSLALQVPTGTVDHVTLRKGMAAGVELEKADGAWRIPSLWNVKADADKIQKFLDAVGAVKGEARGQSDTLFGDFGIMDADALHVILAADGAEVVHLLIGTVSPGPNQAFIRQAGTPTVFLCDNSLLSTLGVTGGVASAELKPDPWTDLRMFSFSPDSVQTVDVRQRAGEWRELGAALPFPRDANQVAPYLQGLLSVRADGVVDPAGTGYGFEEPEWELRLNLKEGAPIVVTVGALKADSATQRYLRISGDPHVYDAAPYILERIKVDSSRFLASNPLGVVKEKLHSLTVHTPERELSLTPAGGSWKGLDEYLASLETFHVARVDTVPVPTADTPAEPYWLTVQFEGQEPATVACDAPSGDDGSNVRCVHRGNPVPFLIARPTFQLLFENVGRLERPAEAAPSAEPAPASPGSTSAARAPAVPAAPASSPPPASH